MRLDIEIFEREAIDLLAAALANAPERDQSAGRHDAELLGELASRRRLRILAGVAFTFGYCPGAIVLVAPERAAGMDQQHQQFAILRL